MTDKTPPGDRIAKVLARAGVASRRGAEEIVAAGRVAVNGRVIDSPALNVTAKDRITVDGKPLAAAEPARLWRYHKPPGLVTSAADEKGRPTVFDRLPEGMPRVMPVGRLDIASEGLLLLTNDGALKRRLELPATGWLRKYRVRVNGSVNDEMLEPLRKGLVIDGETFQPMSVTFDRQQGANAWLTAGLREGRNREVRRAMEAVGLVVNRLIRISYGPFRLEDLAPGAVEEVRAKVLRDQLGLDPADEDVPAVRAPRKAPAGPPRGATELGAPGSGGKRTAKGGKGGGPDKGARRPAPKTGAKAAPSGGTRGGDSATTRLRGDGSSGPERPDKAGGGGARRTPGGGAAGKADDSARGPKPGAGARPRSPTGGPSATSPRTPRPAGPPRRPGPPRPPRG